MAKDLGVGIWIITRILRIAGLSKKSDVDRVANIVIYDSLEKKFLIPIMTDEQIERCIHFLTNYKIPVQEKGFSFSTGTPIFNYSPYETKHKNYSDEEIEMNLFQAKNKRHGKVLH